MSNYFPNYNNAYEDYLSHHGILGQKWGIRRFQNKDGSLTNAGKKRYSNLEFAKAEDAVRSKLSNSYKPFESDPINTYQIMGRSGLNLTETKQCIKLALDKFNEYRKVEPRITNDVISSVDKAGSKMYGLEYRLKQPNSLAGKIGADSKSDNVSLKQAADGIKDVIRYTSVSEDKNFVKNYETVRDDLLNKGYKETKCKNYFDMYRQGKVMHKAVQSTFESPDGYKFELQFQTPSSQAAKELKIPIYEERRKVGVNESRAKELERQMVGLAEQVPDPPNVMRIKTK